jgi:hypothetical protein
MEEKLINHKRKIILIFLFGLTRIIGNESVSSAADKSQYKLNLVCARAISIAYPELQKLQSSDNSDMFKKQFGLVTCSNNEKSIEIMFSDADFRVRGGSITYMISTMNWQISETVFGR